MASTLSHLQWIGEPLPIPLEKYLTEREQFIQHLAKRPELIAVYQNGEPTVPGISDIDLVVVLEERLGKSRPEDFSPRHFFGEEDLGLVSEPFIVTRTVFHHLQEAQSLPRLKPIYGMTLGQESYTPEEWRWITTAQVVDRLGLRWRNYVRYIGSNELPIRPVLVFLNGIVHTLKQIDAMTDQLLGGSFIEEVLALRHGWFNNGAERLEHLETLCTQAGEVLAEAVLMMDRYLMDQKLLVPHPNAKGRLVMENGTIVIFAPLGEISPTELISKVESWRSVPLPPSFGAQLAHYAQKGNGPMAGAIEHSLRGRLSIRTIDPQYEYWLKRRIAAMDHQASFLIANGFRFGGIFGTIVGPPYSREDHAPLVYRLKRATLFAIRNAKGSAPSLCHSSMETDKPFFDNGSAQTLGPGGTFASLLSKRIDEVLRPLILPGVKYALLDFPNYSNIGDHAIWLGEMTWLRQRGIQIVYTSEFKTCSFERLAKSLGDRGVILLSGGGNLGDLHPHHQRLREAIITAFPNHRIVQLPQSIWFEKAENLARAKAVFNRHPDLILLVRDERSLEIARNEFKGPTTLCPDMAFLLGSLTRPFPATSEILWLLRRDKESLGTALMAGLEGRPVDWSDGTMPTFLQITSFLFKQATEHPKKLGSLRRTLSWTYNLMSRQWVEAGCRILSRGEVVITDRLHGHILSLLLGIPHIVLDNNYGKVKSFYETWTKDCTLAHWADSPTEALKIAKMIAIDKKERGFDVEG